jgi:oxygen-independent coproporphyrinogen-3 oxidase
MRFQNVESAAEYVDRWKRGQSPRLATTPANQAEERFFVGLRLAEGIRPQPEEWLRFDEPITRFVKEGLLARDGEQLRLTNRGILLSNEVFAEFIV